MTQAAHLPYQGTMAGFRRFSVAEYHWLIQQEFLTEDDNLELLEGYLVHKMPRNPPHDNAILKGTKRLIRLLPTGWELRVQCAITLTESEPEPDFAVVRGDETTYQTRHPTAADIDLVIEVADSSLPGDRDDKGRIYARNNIACYWIVSVVDKQVEVYTAPSGPTPNPAYGHRADFQPGDLIPLTLGGGPTVQLAVQDLLP